MSGLKNPPAKPPGTEMSHFTHSQSHSISVPWRWLPFPVHVCSLASRGVSQTPGWKEKKRVKRIVPSKRREKEIRQDK